MTEATQAPEMKNVNIVLPVEAVNLVLGALAKQPFDMVADLITAIRTQAVTQLQPTDQVQQLPTQAPKAE